MLYKYFLTTLVLFQGFFSLEAEPRREGAKSYAIVTKRQVNLLTKRLSMKLRALARDHIEHIEDESQKPFIPSKSMIAQQEEAREKFVSQVLPLITTKKEVAADDSSDETATVETATVELVSVRKLDNLSKDKVAKSLELLTSFVRTLPPLPAYAKKCAKALAPLLSFDAENQRTMTSLIDTMLSELLENSGDLRQLAQLHARGESEQKKMLKELRTHYQKKQHAVSQFLYAWTQVASILDSSDPIGTFFRYATVKPQELKGKFNKLVAQARSFLRSSQHQNPSKDDAAGLVMLAIATLYAPDETFALLGGAQKVA